MRCWYYLWLTTRQCSWERNMSAVAASVLNTLLANRHIASLRERTQNTKTQRLLVLTIVCIALLLDNMLYMVIVPIIPVFLENPDSHPLQYKERWFWYSVNNNSTMLKADQVEKLNLTNSPHLKPIPQDFLKDILHWTARMKTGSEDKSIGWLFASKAIVQLFVSPFAGPIIDRYGYERPLIVGLSVLFVSTSIFAFGQSYTVLFLARSLQGVGSAFADTAGLAMIADRFKESRERSRAQGIALAFISFGCLFAPPFGAFLYEFAGKAVPFLALSFITLVDGAMLLLIMQPIEVAATSPAFQMPVDEEKPKEKLHGTPIYRLILRSRSRRGPAAEAVFWPWISSHSSTASFLIHTSPSAPGHWSSPMSTWLSSSQRSRRIWNERCKQKSGKSGSSGCRRSSLTSSASSSPSSWCARTRSASGSSLLSASW